MTHQSNPNRTGHRSGREIGDALDLDTLLHPAKAFARPLDVVRDADLTLNEKRAILASWASDACAIEATPELRATPGESTPVRFDDIIDALRTLDRQASEQYKPPPHYRRVLDLRTSGWRKGRPTGSANDPGASVH